LTMDPSRVAMNVPSDTAESTSQRRSTGEPYPSPHRPAERAARTTGGPAYALCP
jgi:hypothetical protein